MSSDGELYGRVKEAVAKLYVLRDSCTGIIEAEKSGKNLVWFRGAEAVLREALEVLQKALLAQEGELATTKKRAGKDWNDVERLIRKLDNSTLSQSVYS
ncbi:MAG: hypothetical protein LJE88_08320 [Deltaproteobacteria bacterium]|jgi:hypothetical protein|nr:hypothetical protein [Deltaproteobacteria bacterium]